MAWSRYCVHIANLQLSRHFYLPKNFECNNNNCMKIHLDMNMNLTRLSKVVFGDYRDIFSTSRKTRFHLSPESFLPPNV